MAEFENITSPDSVRREYQHVDLHQHLSQYQWRQDTGRGTRRQPPLTRTSFAANRSRSPWTTDNIQRPPSIHHRSAREIHHFQGVYAVSKGSSVCVGAILDPDVEPCTTYPETTTNFSRPSYSRPHTSHSMKSKDSYDDAMEKESRYSSFSDVDSNINDIHTAVMEALGDDEPLRRPQPTPCLGATFGYQEIAFVINVCLAQFLSLAGLSQTFAPLIILSKALGVENPGTMAWPTAAYSLTLGSCILPAGRLGDMFGHKRMFLIGWLWFAFSSLLCGFSLLGGSKMLTACRALQGIGPALLLPNGLALFCRTFPVGMKRNMAISLFGGSGPCGVVIGAVFSSIFSELVWWPWQFWTMGISCFTISILSVVVIPPDNVRSSHYLDTYLKPWQKFDLPGALTGVGGLVIINFALNQAPIDGWSQSYLGILLGIGLVLFCTFIYVELHVAPRPLIPLRGLHRDAGFTLACIAAGWGSHGIWSFYMFLLMENVRGQSPLAACAQFWPVAPIGLSAALAVGFMLKKVKVAHLLSMAMLCFLLGSLLLATAPADQTYFANTFLSVLITPFGMNWSFPTAVILMSNAVSREDQGIAASLVSTMVNYSISTGLGFAGSIDRYVTPKHGVLSGYRGAWYFGIGLSAIGLLISFYFMWLSRTRK